MHLELQGLKKMQATKTFQKAINQPNFYGAFFQIRILSRETVGISMEPLQYHMSTHNPNKFVSKSNLTLNEKQQGD